jgi:hypothetical protein
VRREGSRLGPATGQIASPRGGGYKTRRPRTTCNENDGESR